MIITRTPFRMSFFGGGSDLPAYYEENGGSVLSTSINKYMYINLHKKFDEGVRLAYSKIEEVEHADELQHPLVRNCLKYFNVDGGIEVSSIADIPAKGTGLGSSSSYTVGLVKAISAYKNIILSKYEVADIACEIEIQMCGEPIGKQDQFAASFGGFNCFKFNKDCVKAEPLELPQSLIHHLSASLVSVYTGNCRAASSLLRDQSEQIKDEQKSLIQRKMVDMVSEGIQILHREDIKAFGQLLHESWSLKKQLTNKITNTQIDEIYEIGMNSGAWGGKLLGAGMGGFITFITEPANVPELKNALSRYKLIDLLPEQGGSKILYNSDGDT